MVLVPSVFNTFQVWIQDNFLKKAKFSEDFDMSLEDIEDDTFLRICEVYQFRVNSRDLETLDSNRKKVEQIEEKKDSEKRKKNKLVK